MTGPVAFFDGIGTAHSLPLIAGLDRAAAARGLRRQWTTAIRPPDAGDASCEWVPTRAFYGEFCERGTTAPFAYRSAWRHAIDRAADSGAAFFCDLAVEQLLGSQGTPLRVGLPAVWIVHQVPVPRDTRPPALRAKMLVANPTRWRRQARALHQRAVLRRLARADGRFVVPSEAAKDRLGRIVAADLIHVAAWPIASAAAPPQLATDAPDEVVAVFPGECRPGKGLDVLMQALPAVTGVDAFDLPSVVTADAQALVAAASDPRVRMGTSWATNEAYQEHLRAAALAVLPYRSAATSNAGISASLLDVLAVGLPAVITRPIAGGLPDGYGGAVVVEPDSPSALAAGIAKAIANLDELRGRARVEGPAFVLEHHTYERYLQTIVEAGAR
ncbi:MAG TPA: glycosyltransferase [Acidimicrobiia bacterium]|nr:glycosyltransferase [Acidimicrobiia bacterium]